MLHKPTSVRIVKRPDSRYYQLEYKDPMTGGRRRESVHATKRRKAEAKVEHLQAQLNPMTVTPLSAGIVFSKLTSEYIERHAQMRLAETTIIDYKRRVGIIKPYFSRISMDRQYI